MENCVVSDNKDIVYEVMFDYNPLAKVEIATFDEIKQARNIAKDIVGKQEFRPELCEIMIELIASTILHCLYAHYSDTQHYSYFPTLESIVRMFKINIVEETYEDEDRSETVCIKPKNFMDTLKSSLNFEHVPYEGIIVKRLDFYRKSDNETGKKLCDVKVISETLHELYPYDIDLYEVNPYVHPWIYRNFIYFVSSESSLVDDAILLVPLIIEKYLDKHPEYSEYFLDDKIWKKSNPDNLLAQDDEMKNKKGLKDLFKFGK